MTTQQQLESVSLDVFLDTDKSIAILEPRAKLSKKDFDAASDALDPFIGEQGAPRNLMIKTRYFPGWASVEDIAEHFKFIKEHHEKIERVALVTDAPIAPMVEKMANLLIESEVKHFQFTDAEYAEQWMSAA